MLLLHAKKGLHLFLLIKQQQQSGWRYNIKGKKEMSNRHPIAYVRCVIFVFFFFFFGEGGDFPTELSLSFESLVP